MTTMLSVQQPAVANDRTKRTICALIHRMGIGGAEVLAYQLAKDLSEHYRFVFACMDEIGPLGEELKALGFPITCLKRAPGIDFGCAARLQTFLAEHQVDLIHAHQYTAFFQAILARKLRSTPPIVFTEHGRHQPDLRSWKRAAFNRLTLRGNDRVVAVGEAVRQALIDIEGFPASRVDVILNGIPLDRFLLDRAHAQQVRRQQRRQLGLPDTAFVLIQVARLDYLKDHITALKTIHALRERNLSVTLLLVGDGPMRGEIETVVHQLHLDDQVRLLGERRDVEKLLPAADTFLLTSLNEGIPLTIIEAMAAALPIVATRVGGLPELIHEATTGFLAPAKDSEALADRIECLTQSPDLRIQFGEQGRRRAKENFSIRAMHASYRQLYEELIHA